MIDCDIHINPGDPEEFLSFVEPAQRDWFRGQGPMFGLPGYPWAHPTGWFRQDAEPGPAGMAGTSLAGVQHDVLDPFGTEIGILSADDGVAVSLMPSPYRAAAYARAHNDWMRERWLEREPRLRGSIICPAQDPAQAAAEVRRCAEHACFAAVREREAGDPGHYELSGREVLRCPWHGWEFDAESGECPDDQRMRVKTYPVRVQDGTVEVLA